MGYGGPAGTGLESAAPRVKTARGQGARTLR